MKMKYGLTPQTILKINTVFSHHPLVEEVILYGSRAKGNFKPGSDIDFTLKGSALTLSVLDKISWELDDLLMPYTIDLSLYHHIENVDLLNHISRVGVPFYEKENLLV